MVNSDARSTCRRWLGAVRRIGELLNDFEFKGWSSTENWYLAWAWLVSQLATLKDGQHPETSITCRALGV
jgi:hypothetical protein